MRTRLLCSPVLLALLAAGLCMPSIVRAQQAADQPVMRPLTPSDTGSLDRGPRPSSEPEKGKGGADGKAEAEDDPQGLNIFARMGAPLPDAPTEKEFKGTVDEAYGAYQRGLFTTAIDKALPRAQLGDPAAQTLLAELMGRGLGVKKDTKGAAFWYGQAAQGGDPPAMFKYALLLMEGKDVPHDKAKADEYMRKAADAGNSSAQFNWAQILVSDNPGVKGLTLALPYYEKAAEQGVADAQYAVAQIYSVLKDLPDEKKAKARDWLGRAARAGFDTAQLDMGIWLVNGIGGPRDYERGFRWLSISARRGNAVAQNRLSHLYINALGTKPDPIEAAKWYVLSRRAGLKDPALEDFYLGLTDEEQKKAIDAANKFRRG
ncbi:sel1 repeat family protein [Rhizobium daejeonense]|uniref:Sel1 repeat family protein n=1 Tax=Rhizobium daejeonense TaxID=240521 RepID=A0A6M1RZ65_9HYPH|nr:tetratricopeptide repeat protein [Rhizobium daejeonense]NGO62257.1 sel1 repeat family protein [Rhizobium daejeonense]